MAIFDFMSEGVEEALAGIAQQIERTETIEQEIRAVVAPLENGGWIGEGAEAFFDDTRQFIADLNQTREQMRAYQNALNQTMGMIQEATQAITGIING